MADGNWPYIGAAACGGGIYADGEWVSIQRLDGGWDTYHCEDTGDLGWFHVDLYGIADAAQIYGDYAVVVVN